MGYLICCGVLLHMLLVQIDKRADGSGVLRCTRADGSVTWQKQTRHALHFALHDLTHFAVESTLGFRRGFFGLIAAGWAIDDTTGKGARGPLPEEAVEVERIVGFLDTERASGALLTAEDYNQYAATQTSASGRPAPRQLTDAEIARVRTCRGELFSRWSALEPGDALELRFSAF
jgi:hypothetical protein